MSRKKTIDYPNNIVFRVGNDFLKQIRSLAKKEKTSLSSLIRKILTDHMGPGNSK
jgi:hypothetical protein